jgi:hypothetical protein
VEPSGQNQNYRIDLPPPLSLPYRYQLHRPQEELTKDTYVINILNVDPDLEAIRLWIKEIEIRMRIKNCLYEKTTEAKKNMNDVLRKNYNVAKLKL